MKIEPFNQKVFHKYLDNILHELRIMNTTNKKILKLLEDE